MRVLVQRATFQELPAVYAVYFEVFRQATLQGTLLFDLPERGIRRLTIPRTIATRLVHVLLTRLSTAAHQGSIAPLFHSQWDPIPLKIVVNNKIVGCCFLVRHNPKVFELGIIGVLETKRGLGIGAQAVEAVKKYARRMGATRIIVGSGARRTAGFFVKCGFKRAFSEEVIFVDIK